MIAQLLEGMVGATLLMVLVLAARGPVAHFFGASWAYALWLLPALRLVLPPLPLFQTPLPVPSVTVIVPSAEMLAAPVAPAGGGMPWLELALAVWAGGAVIFLFWQQSTYSAFLLHLGPEGRPARPPEFGGIPVVESEAVDGPVALGLLKRRIVVPTDFATRYSEVEQRLALEHELIHHRRFDLVWNFVAVAILALNWFNPIAHFAFRAFRADQELACDAAVARRSPGQCHDYACALVKSASRPGLIATCPLGPADELKRRLKMMKQHRGGWGRALGGAATVLAVGATGLALSSPSLARPEPQARVVMAAAAAAQAPIITEQEIRTLREKCGEGQSGAIVCDDDNRDPEVRAIVDKTVKRAEARVAEAMPSPERMAEIEAAVAKAQEAVARIDHAKIDAQVREAMEKSRVHIVRAEQIRNDPRIREALRRAQVVHVDASRQAAIASAVAAARAHAARTAITPEQMAEIHAAIDEARRAMEDIDIDIDRELDIDIDREIDAEVEAELDKLSSIDFDAPGQCSGDDRKPKAKGVRAVVA
jgi:bla regulator protein blaR1